MRVPLQERISSGTLVENRSILFLLFFLALSAIALSTWQGVSFFKEKRDRARNAQILILNGLNNLYERAMGELSGPISALHMVSLSPFLAQGTTGNGESTAQIRSQFVALLEAAPDVYQAKLVDAFGSEIIRLERNGTESHFVEGNDLRNRSDTDVLKIASSLASNQLYVSRLELQKELGVVQEPWRPTIRVAAAIRNPDSSLAGTVIVNVDITDIIQNYSDTNDSFRIEIMLVDEEGYWIFGRPPEKSWGFLFSNLEDRFGNEYPEVWDKIHRTKQRIFPVGEDSWSFQRLTVKDLFPDTLSYIDPDQVMWFAIIKNPPLPIIASPLGYIPLIAIITALVAFSWVLAQNVLERRRAEKELFKSEKLSSLGGLVAGVSHELNTPIGSAVTIASTLQESAASLDADIKRGQIRKSDIANFVSDVRQASTIMLRGLSRATELINHFKQVAVDQSVETRRKFDFDNYVEELAATFQHLFKHRPIELELELEAHTMLNTYPGPLGQIVINLVQNSLLHGFNLKDPGIIRISTRRKSESEVELVVADNGRGIPAEIINRVFDPFFTTKLGQGGSGLGLNIVYNLVTEALKGEINVISDTERQFTQFTVTFPSTHPSAKKSTARGVGYAEKPTT